MSENKVPQMSGMKQVVWHPGTQDAIPTDPARALIDNKIALDANKKLRICHAGTEDNNLDQGRTSREVIEVVATQDILDEYGIDNRPYINGTYPTGLIGQTIKVPVDADPMKMPVGDAKPNEVDGWNWENGSSSSANDSDLICPADAFVTDNGQTVYNDLPGKTGGPVMNEDNYLSFSGSGKNIPGDI